jgi:FtsP/CotA-like multicopper oxidase with cupredoxin domain
MDGPTGVTQCPIPPGGSFTYDFVVSSDSIPVTKATHTCLGKPSRFILVPLP